MTAAHRVGTGPTWAAVFDGLEWPVERWQLLAAADGYGVSPWICALLVHVPERRYGDLAEIEHALDAVATAGTHR
jgi:hypothetical protein